MKITFEQARSDAPIVNGERQYISETWYADGSWGAVAIDGLFLLDRFGNYRRFKTEVGARKAAAKFLRRFPR